MALSRKEHLEKENRHYSELVKASCAHKYRRQRPVGDHRLGTYKALEWETSVLHFSIFIEVLWRLHILNTMHMIHTSKQH